MSENKLPRRVPQTSVSVENLRFTGSPLSPERLQVVTGMLGGVGIYVARAGLDTHSPALPAVDPEDPRTPEEQFQEDLEGIQIRVRAIDEAIRTMGSSWAIEGIERLDGDFVNGLTGRLSGDLGYMARMTDVLRTSDHPSDRGLAVFLLDDLHRAYVERGEPFDPMAEAEKWRLLKNDGDHDAYRCSVQDYARDAFLMLLPDIHEMVREGRSDLASFRDALAEVDGGVIPLPGFNAEPL